MTAVWVGQELVQPIAPDRPCGENLEDTQLLASFDAFRLFGQSAPHDPVPEWSAIANRAAEALCKSKDLRLLAHLGIRAAADRRPAGVRRDADDRVALAGDVLARDVSARRRRRDPPAKRAELLRRSRWPWSTGCAALPLVEQPAARHVQPARHRDRGGPAGRATARRRPDEARINAAFAAMSRDELTRLQESVGRSLAALDEHRRQDARGRRARRGAELRPAVVAARRRSIACCARSWRCVPTAAMRTERAAASPGEAEARPAAVGAIRSRQDAIRALDAVADFFRQHEPSSPIPLIVDRAKRLVSKDFLEVLDDIAPGRGRRRRERPAG